MKNTMKNTVNNIDNNNLNLTIEEKAWILSMRKITPEMAPTLEKYPTLENFLQEIGLPKNLSFNRGNYAYAYVVHIKEDEAYLSSAEDKIYLDEPKFKTHLLSGLVWEASVKGIFGSDMPLTLRVHIHHGRVICAEVDEFDSEIHADNFGPNLVCYPQVVETLFKDFKQQLDEAISLTEEDIEDYQNSIKDAKRKLRSFYKIKEYLKNKQ